MKLCIDASDEHGTGSGLLTKGKKYVIYGSLGGYYIVECDDGIQRSKSKIRFK